MELVCLHNYTSNKSHSGVLQSLEPNLQRHLLQWLTGVTVPLSSDLSMDSAFSSLSARHEILQTPDSAVETQIKNWKKKQKQNTHTLKHAGYYFLFLVVSSPDGGVSEWCVCVCCVNVHVLFTRAVKACWNVDILVLYFQRCFRAYEKISFMFL